MIQIIEITMITVIMIMVRHPHHAWKGRITKKAFRVTIYIYIYECIAKQLVEQMYVAYPDPTTIIVGDDGFRQISPS